MKSCRTTTIAMVFATLSAIHSPQKRPIVATSCGQLEGVLETSFSTFSTFYSFKGIPYAEPPIGNLRFRNPIMHKAWEGVRDASSYGNRCLSNGILGIFAGGDEDCLFLNVYSPDLRGNYPVMFWIHGGAFAFGDGGSFMFGPDFLVNEKVVVVTMNYRLASLGFLSTQDRHAQGNYGLKDITMALKWVQVNIASFGGNPNKVTVFGQSAGSAAIQLLLMSPMSTGLFHRAIMQSGSVLAPFALQPNAREKAEEIGRQLKLKFTSTKSLMNQLRQVDAKMLTGAERRLFFMEMPGLFHPFDFVPSIEPEDSIEERFLTDDPTTLLNNGKFMHVPMMMGSTSNEGLPMIFEKYLHSNIYEHVNENENIIVPISFKLNRNSSESRRVAKILKNMYFMGKNLSGDTFEGWSNYHTDAHFKFPTDRAIKYFARNSSRPIYSYLFNFDGAFNVMKTLVMLKGYKGSTHCDDIFYLFSPDFPLPVMPWDHSVTVRKRMVKLWANFAKFGNPTPRTDELINQLWPPYSLEGEEYFDIDHDLSVKRQHERFQIWHDLQMSSTGHL